MSAFENRIDAAVCDAIDHGEMVGDFIATTCEQLGADDDVLAEGLSDALFDPRTRGRIVRLVRAGDLLEAMKVMHEHATTTYITEAAEVAAEKAFRA